MDIPTACRICSACGLWVDGVTRTAASEQLSARPSIGLFVKVGFPQTDILVTSGWIFKITQKAIPQLVKFFYRFHIPTSDYKHALVSQNKIS